MTASEARAHTLARLRSRTFDVAVIGGGIAGTSVARDAALRGLSVALLERGDIASGTSSGSTKLAHGGVRYLQQLQWRLVRQSCREREILRALAPDDVHPLEFLYPITSHGSAPGRTVPAWLLHAGLTLYDRFAGDGARGRGHRMLRAQDVYAIEPHLRRDVVRGAALYTDATLDDARVTLLTARAADALGALIAPRAEVLTAQRTVDGSFVLETRADETMQIRARTIVNAAGPWVGEVAARVRAPIASPHVRLTQGVHLVLSHARLPLAHAIVLHAPGDDRLTFALPWRGATLVGTTDTDVASATDARVRAEDARYLLETANWWFPDARLTDADVQATTVAVRALACASDVARAPSDVSREHAIVQSGGVVSLIGGKLTGARAIAEEVVDHVAAYLSAQGTPVKRGIGRTATVPLTNRATSAWAGDDARAHALLPRDTIDRLAVRWGTDMHGLVTQLEASDDARMEIAPELLAAEVTFMAEREWAMSTLDVLARRTRTMLLDARNGLDAAPRVAQMLGRAWGWNDERIARDVAGYAGAVRAMHAWRGHGS